MKSRMSLALPYLEVEVTWKMNENVDVEQEIESVMGTRDGWFTDSLCLWEP